MSKQDIFKTGDTFGGKCTLRHPVTRKGIPLTPNMSFACTLQTSRGKFIADLEAIPHPDQDNFPGQVILTYSGDTSHWPEGIIQTDLKVMINGVIKHTGTMSFPAEKGITP